MRNVFAWPAFLNRNIKGVVKYCRTHRWACCQENHCAAREGCTWNAAGGPYKKKSEGG